jgi:hypothetical protein
LRRSVDREPGKPKDRKGVAWHLLSRGSGQLFNIKLARSDRRESEDAAVLNGDICHAEVVSELILAGIVAGKAVESFIP